MKQNAEETKRLLEQDISDVLATPFELTPKEPSLPSGWIWSHWTFTTRRGVTLFTRSYLPPVGVKPKAVVVHVHGVHEHGGNFADLVTALTGQGFAVYLPDMEGHGRSSSGVDEPNCGTTSSMPDLGGDVLELIHALGRDFVPETPPVYLIGHSMGTCVTLAAVASKSPAVAGLILSAPTVEATAVNVASKWAARWNLSPTGYQRLLTVMDFIMPIFGILTTFTSWFHPGGNLPYEEHIEKLSRCPDYVARRRIDPYSMSQGIRYRTASNIWLWTLRVLKEARKVNVPVLVLQGTDDTVVHASGAEKLVGSIPKSELIVYDGAYHELFNDPHRDEVFEHVIDFINKHLSSASPSILHVRDTTTFESVFAHTHDDF